MIGYLRSFLTKESGRQFGTMVGIGFLNTVVDFSLVKVFLDSLHWGTYVSVSVAFLVATVVAYWLNKRFTFGQSGIGTAAESASFLLVNVAALAVTNGFVFGAIRLFGDLDSTQVLLTKVAATAVILLPKFASYRDLVFGGSNRRS